MDPDQIKLTTKGIFRRIEIPCDVVLKDTKRSKDKDHKEVVNIVIKYSKILIKDKEEWVQPTVVRLQATQEPGAGRQDTRTRTRGNQ